MLKTIGARLSRHAGLLVSALGIGAIIVLVYALGLNEIGFSGLARNSAELSRRVGEQPVLSAALAIALYAGLVVALLPGVPLMTIPMGLVFGWAGASVIVLAAMLLGVSILFFATTRILPEQFAGRAGSRLARFAGGIRENAVSYLLFLRLMPAVPFTLLNIALPALKIAYPVFALTTLAGMLPRVLAYAYAGQGLRSVIAERTRDCPPVPEPCGQVLAARDFLTSEVLISTALLGLVALAPILLRWIARRRSGA